MAQLKGVEASRVGSWAVWNAAANFRATFAALARLGNIEYSEPKLYETLPDLRKKKKGAAG